MTPEDLSILIVHSSSGHSGKTTICASLVRDLPFDVYIKLSRGSPHLSARSLSAGTLPPMEGDTGRLLQLVRSPRLAPLMDVLFLDGPREETDNAVRLALDRWPTGTRVLVEGFSAPIPRRSATMYVLGCPLPADAKPDTGLRVAQADLIVINRFPACSPPVEAALLALLRDWNPRADQVVGSAEDAVFLATIETAVLRLLPSLGSA